jgi:hypothetical protein
MAGTNSSQSMDCTIVPENSHLTFIHGPNIMLQQSQKVFLGKTKPIFLFKINRFYKRMKIETQIEKIVKISGTSINF